MPLFRRLTGPIIRTAEQGADTILWLGGAPEPLQSTGLFWHDRRPRPTHYLIGPRAERPEDRQRLSELCQSLLAAGKA